MKPKTMINPRWTFVMIALTILTNHRCSGKAIEKLSDSLTRHTIGPYSTNTEEVQKHVIYLNGSVSDEVTAMLARFNMSVDELKRQREAYIRKKGAQDNFNPMTTTEMTKFSTSDDAWVDEMCGAIFLKYYHGKFVMKKKSENSTGLVINIFRCSLSQLRRLSSPGRIFYFVFLLFCNKKKTLFWKCDKKSEKITVFLYFNMQIFHWKNIWVKLMSPYPPSLVK